MRQDKMMTMMTMNQGKDHRPPPPKTKAGATVFLAAVPPPVMRTPAKMTWTRRQNLKKQINMEVGSEMVGRWNLVMMMTTRRIPRLTNNDEQAPPIRPGRLLGPVGHH